MTEFEKGIQAAFDFYFSHTVVSQDNGRGGYDTHIAPASDRMRQWPQNNLHKGMWITAATNHYVKEAAQ